jgi:glycosyltransferase involved in cell wall biosynthesis
MILGCSQYITSKIKERFPDLAARCDTVPNGVDVEFFEQKRETTPTPGNGQVRLLFVGRVSPEKGLHTLIDAFLKVQRHHLQIKLEIIGPDAATPVEFLVALSAEDHVKGLAEFYDGNYLSYLKNRAACKSGQVSFIGHVPYRALPAYYQRADILVNPSFSESFGMSLIEGMASGLPVVATRIGGMIETVEHGKTGMLVNVGRSDELADAIRHLVEDGKLRRRMGAAGYHRVRSLFSWDRVADRVRCCYDKLIRQASETLV